MSLFGIIGAEEYARFIPLCPLLAALVIAFVGHKLRDGGGWIAVTMAGASLLFAFGTLTDSWALAPGVAIEQSWTWVSWGAAGRWDMGIYVDQISGLMGFIVAFVGFLVVLYSQAYMAKDDAKQRYYAVISMFIGVMLGLVYANNYLMMFMMWELVGVCSYLLIGHWYKKPEAAAAAKKAFLVTRIGDVLFLVGIVVLYNTFHTFQFSTIFAMGGGLAAYTHVLTTIVLLLFGGAVGKSAQFPLHVWLPDAMEGPTTVSALIHAATMVKAGVFLVARSYPLIVHAGIEAPTAIAWIGAITAFMAASMGLVAWDIKRVMAYSTISQLGYMMAALGAGATSEMHSRGFSAGMFHLWNHAFFKALLFLAAGSVIHAVHSNDMRVMGGLRRKMPITALTTAVGVCALAGVPPFSGFWSKDEVLAVAYDSNVLGNMGVFFLLLSAAFLTAFYAFRMWWLTFGGVPKTKQAKHAHESPLIMTAPLVILAGFAGLSGLIGSPVAPASWLFQGHIAFGEAEHAVGFNLGVLGAALAVTVIGIALSYQFYSAKVWRAKGADATGLEKSLYTLVAEKYYMDHLYLFVARRIVVPFTVLQNKFDQWGIDGAVNGIADGIFALGRNLRRLQTGIASHYATMILVGVALLVAVVLRDRLFGYIAAVTGLGG